MHTFARSVALITLFAVATRGIGFLFRIVLSRILGAELLGIYQIAFSFFMVFMTIIASGLPLIISKEVAAILTKNKNRPLYSANPRPYSTIAQVATAGLIISIAASLVIIAIIYPFQRLIYPLFTDTRSIPILLILIPSILAYSIYTTLRAIWWGQKKFFILGATELIEQVARVLIFGLLMIFAFWFTNLVQVAALSFTLATVVSATIVVIIFLKIQKKDRAGGPKSRGMRDIPWKTTPLKPLLRSASPITAVRALASIALPIIAIIVPMRLVTAGWSSGDAIAHFGIAVGMTLPLLSIPQTVISSIATALVPDLAASRERRDKNRISTQIISCIKFTLLINFLLIPVFMAVGPGIGILLFANETAGVYLARSAWIMVPMSLSLITNAILNSLGAETRAMIHYIIGSVALFTAVWVLPQYVGVTALIIGLGVCMTIASILNLQLITRLTGTQTKAATYILAFSAISAPAILAGLFVYGTIGHAIPQILSVPIASGIATIILVGLAYVFNLIDFDRLLKFRRKAKSSEL